MMTNERRRQVEAIFDEAVELEPGQRTAFIEERCAADSALRSAVESLLRAHAESPDFLEPPMPAAAVSLLSQFSDAGMVGRMVGQYQLVDVVASGGMGTVFKAVHPGSDDDEPVAVKLIRHGMDTRDIVRRFHQERQTLSGLRHPNIAVMLDAGTTDAGQPYLVMEYIAGKPIDRHCDEQNLPIRERLELMRTVCFAVQYAHRNLIVHRDLKPSNILVTTNGVPKLVDFGIAKLMTGDTRGATGSGTAGDSPYDPLTATGFRVVTPQYASPEVLRGEPVSTAMDVYSLGLVMYELLVGRRPYDVTRRPAREALRLVCDIDPQPPSTVVTQGFDITAGDGTTIRVTPDMLSRQRNTTTQDLQRALQGDLDTVVLTALHKDPARRYASVEQLAEDIGRYLDGFPVRARKDSFAYRATKFLRRNRMATAAVAIVAMSLQLGIAAASWGLVRANREAARARLEANKAARVTEFLQELFAAVDPEIGSADVKVRDVLDQAALRLDTELSDEPEVLATALATIGETYFNLGLHKDAESLLRKALSIRQSLYSKDHPALPQTMTQLGRVLRIAGAHQEAQEIIEEALALDVRFRGRNHQSVVRDLDALAEVLMDKSDLVGTESRLRDALDISRRIHQEDHPDTVSAMEKLCNTLSQAGRHAEAEPLCRDALAMSRRLFTQNHPRVARALRHTGIMLHQQGRFAEAEPLYRQALEMNLKLMGGAHPEVARLQNNLGLLLASTGRRDEGEAMLRDALALRRKLFGNQHLHVAVTLNNLATLLDLHEAEPLLRESLDIARAVFGDEHMQVARAMHHLAVILRQQGQFDQAEPLYREAMRLFRMNMGDEHLMVTYPMLGLGEVLMHQNRPQDAEPLLANCLALRTRHLAPQDLRVIASQNALGQCLVLLERYEEAEPLLANSTAMILDNPSATTFEQQLALQRITELYEAIGKNDLAQTYRALLPLPDEFPGPPRF
jgi:eukaryotic-like serine/threonine-protein kinase